MRTEDGYDRQAQLVSDDPESAKVYGVKGPSALNRAIFHVVGDLPSDSMTYWKECLHYTRKCY